MSRNNVGCGSLLGIVLATTFLGLVAARHPKFDIPGQAGFIVALTCLAAVATVSLCLLIKGCCFDGVPPSKLDTAVDDELDISRVKNIQIKNIQSV